MKKVQLRNGNEDICPLVTSDAIITTDGANIENSIKTVDDKVEAVDDKVKTVETKVDTKMDKTGGTFTGVIKANNNTQYSTAQVRNIVLSTAEPTSSNGSNGDIWIVYEA